MRAPLLLALMLAVPLAAAADDAADSRAARAAFQKGQTEYNLGNYVEAAKQFEETYRIKPVPALLFNIAQCYRFTGNLEKAVQTYRSFLRNAPATDKNIPLARELLQQVEAALATKTRAEQRAPHGLAAGSKPPDAPPGSAAEPPPASASPAPAAPPATHEVKVAIATTPSTPPSASAPPESVSTAPLPTPAEPGSRVFTWVAGGAAVVALGGGAYLGMQSKKTISDLQTGFHTRSELDSGTASAKSQASTATILLAAGGVLAVVSGVLFVLHF